MCGDMIKKSKPDPEIYLETCKKLKIKPEDCFALEDSKNGILSATTAGLKTIMVPDIWEPTIDIEQILYSKFTNLGEVKEHFEQIFNYETLR